MSAARLTQQPLSTGRWIRLEAASQRHSGNGCDRYGRTWVSRGQERPYIGRSRWAGSAHAPLKQACTEPVFQYFRTRPTWAFKYRSPKGLPPSVWSPPERLAVQQPRVRARPQLSPGVPRALEDLEGRVCSRGARGIPNPVDHAQPFPLALHGFK